MAAARQEHHGGAAGGAGDLNSYVTWTATDDTGNAGTAAQRVTIRDTTPPAITLPGDIKVTVEMGVTPEVLRSAVAATCMDIVDGDLPITSNGVVDPDTPGEYVVEQSCTDAAGNPASVTRTVTVAPPAQPLPQPTDLGIANSYDMGNGWRMMSINWTEPGQPPASGYEVTVTGSNGTLLPLSQFEVLTLYHGHYGPLLRSHNMDGSRNPQGDIDIKRAGGAEAIDLHDNLMYRVLPKTIEVYNLDGTHNMTSPIIYDAPEVRPEGLWRTGITVHDSQTWIVDYRPMTEEAVYAHVGVSSYNLTTGSFLGRPIDPPVTRQDAAFVPGGIAYLDGILYVTGTERSTEYPKGYEHVVNAYKTDGTHVPSKSFIPVSTPRGSAYGIAAEDTTGTLWTGFYRDPYIIYVYSSDYDGTHSMLFSFDAGVDVEIHNRLHDVALTPTVTSDTVTVPPGTDHTAYYYYTPANETVTHTVQLATPSSEPPTTIQTRGGAVVVPPVIVFSDTFDSDLGTWTYQERPYGSLNTMFCNDGITGTYTLAHSSENGGSAHVARANVTDMCWFGSAGLARTFDVPAGYDGGDLTVTLGYQSQAGLGLSLIEFICIALGFCTGGQDGLGAQGAATDMADAAAQTGQILGRHANNLFYTVTDSADNDLANGHLFPDGTAVGASWNTATITVPSLDAAACPCEIEVYTTDLDWDVFNKRFSIDNVNATMTAP